MTDTVQAPTARRYEAFISYSHLDESWASWLHKRLETYQGHRKLIGTLNRYGESVPRRLFPVFRDRDELEGASDLPDRIQDALQRSRFLIVVCSPRSARSKWVDEEIRTFKAFGREDRVLALIVDGEPNAPPEASGAAAECFPISLLQRVGSGRELLAERAEPMAADVRKGKDGARNALLKILAGVLGVPFDDLRQRDQERRRRRLMLASAVAGSVITTLAGLTVYGVWQRTLAAQRALEGRSRGLVFDATTTAPSKPDLALLIALEAYAASPTVESRQLLWNLIAAQPRLTRFLPAKGPDPMTVAVDASGRYAVTGDRTGRLTVWDLSAGRIAQGPRDTGGTEVTQVAFVGGSADRIVALRQDDQVIRWDLGAGHKTFRLATADPALVTATLDGKRALVATLDEAGALATWNVDHWPPDRRPVSTLEATGGSIHFIRDATQLAYIDYRDPAITTFELDEPTAPRRIPFAGSRLGFSTADITQDGKWVASVNVDSILEFWRTDTGHGGRLPLQLSDLATTVHFSPDGQTVALGFVKGDVRLVDVFGRKFYVPPLRPSSNSVHALAFDGAGTALVTASAGGVIAQWQAGLLVEDRFLHFVRGCDEALTVSLTLAGTRVVAACNRGTIVAGAVRADAKPLPLLSTGRERVASFALGADGTTAMLVSESGRAAIVKLGTAAIEWLGANARGDRFVASAASGDARVLAAITALGQLLVRDVGEGTSRSVQLPASKAVWSAFALDRRGSTVAVASDEGGLFVGRTTDADLTLTQLPGQIVPEGRLHFMDDSTRLVAISTARRVVAWDLPVPVARPRQLVPGQANLVVLSDDGRVLLTSERDVVHLFDVASGKELARENVRDVADAALSHDGRTAVLNTRGQGWVVWTLDDDDLRRKACELANRELTAEEIQEHLGGSGGVARCSDTRVAPRAQ